MHLYMTAYVNTMTYLISREHKVSSNPHRGRINKSTNPTVPSSNERMTESTIVCNMYKRQCCTSDRYTCRWNLQ